MANLPNNPFAELRNLEARVDQRLDALGRAETNLKGLLDSLRQQIAAAIPVVEQLHKLVPEAKQQAQGAAAMPSIGELSAALAVGMDQARNDLEDQASSLRRRMMDELTGDLKQQKATLLATEAVKPSRSDLDVIVTAFRAEAQSTLDAVRETLTDHLDLLPAEAKLRIDPVIAAVHASRREAEAMVKAAAEGAETDMRQRAEQLRQSIDEIAVVLEQRLTQRTAAMSQRAETAMNALKPAMDERLTALLSALEQTVQTRERDMVARIDAYPKRLDRQLADAEATLMDRMARAERHADDMTAYLEQKLTARTDEVISRLRLKLRHELTTVGTDPRPAADPRPTLQATLFLKGDPRPNLSPAA